VPQVRLHDARHTCATLMHLQRVPIALIVAWLGHAEFHPLCAHMCTPTFHPLRRALGADIAMTAVLLPGRESRHREPRHVDAQACVRQLCDELAETHCVARMSCWATAGGDASVFACSAAYFAQPAHPRRRWLWQQAAHHTRLARWLVCTASTICDWPRNSRNMAGCRLSCVRSRSGSSC
jgi:hypothetical protein